MQASIWTGTLAGFREKASGTDPVPASVAIAAVTASLAIALVAKVLQIAGKNKDVSALLDRVQSESALLAELADRDIAAFDQYMSTRDARPAIEVPIAAARAVVRSLGLCVEAAGVARGLTAADIGAATVLLSGAVRAMLLSVDFNLRYMQAEVQFSQTITGERGELDREAARYADAVALACSPR